MSGEYSHEIGKLEELLNSLQAREQMPAPGVKTGKEAHEKWMKEFDELTALQNKAIGLALLTVPTEVAKVYWRIEMRLNALYPPVRSASAQQETHGNGRE